MKKRVIGGAIAGTLLLLGVIGGTSNNTTSTTDLNKAAEIYKVSPDVKPKEKPICDGTATTHNCIIGGIDYATYIYHPAVPEKTHTETVTTYDKQVVGYCTLCNDGTYSPSCATGRGACSRHGGVAQWNAPRYRDVPVTSTKTVIDSPALEAYYEKATE